ncbi:MAG: hypothetical protein ABSG65_13060 [Bryobacteraceae bacterium]
MPENPNVEREQQDEAKLAALRSAIDEGDASGIAEGDVFDRVRKALNLPTRRIRKIPRSTLDRASTDG